MSRFAIVMLVSVSLMLFAEQALAEGRRVALVVGVGTYENVPKLPNAVNDASAMAQLFRDAGFEVVAARSDVSNIEFKRAIREFEDAVTDSDIAVVYYAGHGIEIRETNYLIPTDAKLVNERDADDEAIPLDRVLNVLEGAKRLRLVILDACRDNPFTNKIKRRVATRAITAGLGRVEPQQTDTLIAYAAKAQAVANDGEGAHSPFTTALLANLTVPGVDVRLAFGRVRDDVLKATNRQQEPFVYGSLGGSTVALVPAKVANLPSGSDEDARAKSDYEIVERVGSKAAWEVYLSTHKIGFYADLARVRLANFPAAKAAVVASRNDPNGSTDAVSTASPPVDVPTIAPTPKPTAAESKAWDKVKTSDSVAAIRKFIDTYPSSPLIPDAQDRLATVERLARDREERLRQEREVARLRQEAELQKKAAEAESKRLEKEAAQQRREAEKARIAEIARQKAEALAAEKQQAAEARARAAEAAARKREEEEEARLAKIAQRKKEEEERAATAAAERAKLELEIAARRREAEEAAQVAAAAAREAERTRQQALKQQQEEAEKAKAAAAEVAAREAKELQRIKAVAAEELRKDAEERRKAAEVEHAKTEAAVSAEDKADAKAAERAEAGRRKAKADAEAERRNADRAAKLADDLKAERAAAAQRRREAEDRRREAEEHRREVREAALASRRKAEAAAHRAAERQAADQRRRAAAAKDAARTRTAQATRPRPAPVPRMQEEARTYAPRSAGGSNPSMMGIGF